MNSSELVSIVGPQGEILGAVTREDAEAANHMTPNVLVFVFDPSGRLWIQRRADDKRHYPGLWDISACGGIIDGESPEDAAIREQCEEMDMSSGLQYVCTFVNAFPDEAGLVERTRLSHVYVSVSDKTPTPTAHAPEFKAVSHDELMQLLETDAESFVPSFRAEYDLARTGYIGRMEGE